MKPPERLARLVERREDTMSGQLCFRSTRIPVAVILDNFRAGYSWDEILENYPSLSIEHLEALLTTIESLSPDQRANFSFD